MFSGIYSESKLWMRRSCSTSAQAESLRVVRLQKKDEAREHGGAAERREGDENGTGNRKEQSQTDGEHRGEGINTAAPNFRFFSLRV